MVNQVSCFSMAEKANDSSTYPVATWLSQRLSRPKTVQQLLPLFEKELKELTSFEVNDLWDYLMEVNVSSRFIQKDPLFQEQQVASAVCTVDCIGLNMHTAVAP